MNSPSKGSVSVYKNRVFARFQRKAKLTDAELLKAVQAAERGLVDADLGGGVIKQRIARSGEGKSGGSRTIILFRRGKRAVYFYGYEKKDRSNIEGEELYAFREAAALFLDFTEAEMEKRVANGTLTRVVEILGEEDGQDLS